MRAPLLSFVIFAASVTPLLAEPLSEPSAFGALKQLPSGESKKVARVEARDVTSRPNRWYILVYDPKDENGLHEYVVAQGVKVASRNISQFAETLTPADVIGGESLKCDSDKAIKIAKEYAEANGVSIASMNFELKRDSAGEPPAWNITCLDAEGKEIGHLHLTAAKGAVLSHEGFAAEPPPPTPAPEKPSVPRAVRADPPPRAVPVAVATPEPTKKPGFSLKKMFTGHD